MNVLLRISLRNLFRQKRRNILLGVAIAFGAMMLILANSFASGISDVIFNRIVSYVAGHVSVTFTNKGNMNKQVFYDRERVLNTIKKTAPEVTDVQEAVGIFSRVVGNGKSDNLIMVGFDLHASVSEEITKRTDDNFKMLVGRMEDIADSTIENPVLLSEEKAKYLNVKKHDILRVRFTDLNGQQQAARLTLAGIFKPSNIFMNSPMFLEIDNVRKLMGYGPNDLATVFLTIKNPKRDAIKLADSIHHALKSPLAIIQGVTPGKSAFAQNISVLSYKSDTVSRKIVSRLLSLDSAIVKPKNAIFIGSATATTLGIVPGDTVVITYHARNAPQPVLLPLKVTATFTEQDSLVPRNVILVNERSFYDDFYKHWPPAADTTKGWFVPKPGHALYSVFAPEWILLDRAKTTTETMNQYSKIGRNRYFGTTVDVSSMYETASDILKIEVVLNLITVSGVMILFFIILIGVVNSLRMTIRERTREIGTVRAIGMQKKDVRNTFILETFFLTLIASIIGSICSFILMGTLSLFTIPAQDSPLGMILIKGHLHFTPSVTAIICFNALICLIAVATAYFPARRAANLSAVEALRHYE